MTRVTIELSGECETGILNMLELIQMLNNDDSTKQVKLEFGFDGSGNDKMKIISVEQVNENMTKSKAMEILGL